MSMNGVILYPKPALNLENFQKINEKSEDRTRIHDSIHHAESWCIKLTKKTASSGSELG